MQEAHVASGSVTQNVQNNAPIGQQNNIGNVTGGATFTKQ
jgi:hypothetical protein